MPVVKCMKFHRPGLRIWGGIGWWSMAKPGRQARVWLWIAWCQGPHLISKSELVKDFKQRSNSIQSDFFFSFLAAPMAYGHSRGIECCLRENARALNRCATAGNPWFDFKKSTLATSMGLDQQAWSESRRLAYNHASNTGKREMVMGGGEPKGGEEWQIYDEGMDICVEAGKMDWTQ